MLVHLDCSTERVICFCVFFFFFFFFFFFVFFFLLLLLFFFFLFVFFFFFFFCFFFCFFFVCFYLEFPSTNLMSAICFLDSSFIPTIFCLLPEDLYVILDL